MAFDETNRTNNNNDEEANDRLADMPVSFSRKRRREAILSPMTIMSRRRSSLTSVGDTERSELLPPLPPPPPPINMTTNTHRLIANNNIDKTAAVNNNSSLLHDAASTSSAASIDILTADSRIQSDHRTEVFRQTRIDNNMSKHNDDHHHDHHHHDNENGHGGGDDEMDMDEEEDDEGVRKYAKLILPHVGLVLLTCAYTLLGASIFYSVERPYELASKRAQLDSISRNQQNFLDVMWTTARNADADAMQWKRSGKLHMHNLSDELFRAFEKTFITAKEVRANDTIEIWSFSTAIFFAVTVVTTIGYGNPVPVTMQGRLICIFFALFGIPLTLVTIADIGKFLSEHLIWLYGHYLRIKVSFSRSKHKDRGAAGEHVCEHCRQQGLSQNMDIAEEKRIPATLVLAILVLYTALGGFLMSELEPWNFFTSFYYSFITLTTVGFGDLMPRRDSYMYLILLYIILGLAITTMCIDLVGVQYIRKIHYFGRKIQDARTALAVVGGKVVLVSELYANLMQKRAKNGNREAFIIENLYISKHIIPFIPTDIRLIRYIDQSGGFGGGAGGAGGAGGVGGAGADSMSTSTSSVEMLQSCRFCHSRFSISHQQLHQSHPQPCT